jgi:beta-aspartyl-peptidase (threonine type)
MMHRFLLIIFCLFAVCGGGCRSSDPEEAEADIRAVMDAQIEAWNRGDIESYLDGYINSPALLFASRGTFSRGWDPLLERYKVAYPQGNMGRLRFDGVEVHMIGDDTAWVIGSWWLDLDDSSPHGAFTLIFKKTDDGWRIIHDHSSGVEIPAED